MHTVDASETVGRMVEFFPASSSRSSARCSPESFAASSAQRLLPKVDGGRVAAVEVMVNNAASRT